jgi:hypothetical protein
MIVIRYEDARNAVVAELTGMERALDRAIVRLRRKADGGDLSNYCKQNCNLCIDALESFQGARGGMDVGNSQFRRAALHNTKLRVAGVNISVSIDLMTQEIDRNGKESIGGAILVLSRSMRNEKEMAARCKAVALLVYQLLKSQPNTAPHCDPTLCMAIDVFNAKIYRAKNQQKQLLRTVETSCEEVSTVWPVIEPPANYNGPPVFKIA